MESRSEKYFKESLNHQSNSYSTRSSRNARLYKQLYGKYEDLDNLPLEDNTDEIDMEKLKELVLNTKTDLEEKQIKENLNILEQRKRKIDEQKLYDINKILEKAKYENNKLKDTITDNSKVNRNILSALGSSEISLMEIQKANEKYRDTSASKSLGLEDELSMTRELKYQNLGQAETNLNSREDLSLDLFEDLKPNGDTIVTEPIQEDQQKETNLLQEDFRSSDTRDIDIIKSEQKKVDHDFFTNSYEFSKKDFAVDDDFEDLRKKNGIWKILLLILAITVFIGVIVYFVGTYGLGI